MFIAQRIFDTLELRRSGMWSLAIGRCVCGETKHVTPNGVLECQRGALLETLHS